MPCNSVSVTVTQASVDLAKWLSASEDNREKLVAYLEQQGATRVRATAMSNNMVEVSMDIDADPVTVLFQGFSVTTRASRYTREKAEALVKAALPHMSQRAIVDTFKAADLTPYNFFQQDNGALEFTINL